MTSEIIDIFDVQIEAPEQFDVVVEQTEVKLDTLSITENGTYYPQGSATGFSKVEANVLPKSTDIVITENGEYYPNDYEVDAFVKVGVDVKPKLEDTTITDNGTYTPSESFDGFGKVNVDVQPPKLKLSLLEVRNNIGINAEGRWDYDTLLDTSDVTSFANMFYWSTNLKTIDVSNWDTSKVTNIGSMFYGCTNLKEVKGMDNFDVSKVTNCTSPLRNTAVEIIDLNKWDVSNWTKMNEIFREVKATHIYVDKWNTSNVTSFQNAFLYCQKLQYLDITNWDFSSATTVFQMFQNTPIKNFIGDRTIEEVLANNISVFKGLKVGFTTNQSVIDRATLRAMINGVADLTGQTSQTLSIGSVNMKRLTEEDIAIATAKNWSIA